MVRPSVVALLLRQVNRIIRNGITQKHQEKAKAVIVAILALGMVLVPVLALVVPDIMVRVVMEVNDVKQESVLTVV